MHVAFIASLGKRLRNCRDARLRVRIAQEVNIGVKEVMEEQAAIRLDRIFKVCHVMAWNPTIQTVDGRPRLHRVVKCPTARRGSIAGRRTTCGVSLRAGWVIATDSDGLRAARVIPCAKCYP